MIIIRANTGIKAVVELICTFSEEHVPWCHGCSITAQNQGAVVAQFVALVPREWHSQVHRNQLGLELLFFVCECV